ncbi:MAG: hypothetical protein CXR30_16575 [Geobacter sp.]|nr:MAG: hypothetical protein CXR30_16575 [Geobacter sp.]
MPLPGKIFISHASSDKSFVDKLVGDLTSKSIPVWYDKFDLRIGDSVPGSINDGISESRYFGIVLSQAAVASKWVREELNAALMKQVADGGTFIVPMLVEDCNIPPLLAHRRYADFRGNYQSALDELLAVWEQDSIACIGAGKESVHPWPDLEMPDIEYVYLHSTRFDKFFRMSCSLDWTANRAIDYLVNTLKLPWNVEVQSVGMKWSFSYGLLYEDESISLNTTLREARVENGATLKIRINGTYEDLYEKELKEAFGSDKLYMMTMDIIKRHEWLKQQVAARKLLTKNRLKEIADGCFSHV